jgi:hypothetical protein
MYWWEKFSIVFAPFGLAIGIYSFISHGLINIFGYINVIVWTALFYLILKDNP